MTCNHLTCQQGRLCRTRLHRVTLCEQEGADTDEPPVTPFSVANELRWFAIITGRCLVATAVVVAWALVVHFVQ